MNANPPRPGYEKTQHGYWHLVLLFVAAGVLVAGSLGVQPPVVRYLALAGSAVLAGCGLIFGRMTVRDEGDFLAIRFGPLPLLRKRIRYADITAAEPGRTRVIDGWGIHYIFGRGWTYNIWGFGCVKLTLGRKVIRVGTADAENLAAFLRGKMAESKAAVGQAAADRNA